jgi:hypothetical protein
VSAADEAVRAAELLAAQDKAAALFAAVEQRGLVRPGMLETQASDAIRDLRLRDALPAVFDAGRAFFGANQDITGEQLFAHVVLLSEKAGWDFGGEIAGHLVGEFPHERIAGDTVEYYIAPGSDKPMRRTDRRGRACHWILEVHLVDRDAQVGGFFEELLDI